jgi:hypothetical protein
MVFSGKRDRNPGRGVLVDGNILELPALAKDELRHSPDGFEWGYAGSGPAELARAILVTVLPEDRAMRTPSCYQRFKFDRVAHFGDSWRITGEDVLQWVEAWKKSEAGREVQEFLAIKDRLDRELGEWEGGG